VATLDELFAIAGSEPFGAVEAWLLGGIDLV
jgi:hypothetical protein